MTPAGLLQRRAWTISLALLGLLLAMEFTQLDVALARVFFDPARRDFPLREVWFTTTVSHDAMRLAAGAALAWVALSPWLPLGFLRRLDRRARFYLLASTAASLIVVTGLKRLSYSFCPWDLVEFGGRAQYLRLLEWPAAGTVPGRCLPAGHVAAASAFLGGFFAFPPALRRTARTWLAAVLVLTAWTGLAQQARGAHFLSHTLWTAWWCWTLSTALGECWRLPDPFGHAPNGAP
jgi:membrane-associated PAP2 superfamily phosphatase